MKRFNFFIVFFLFLSGFLFAQQEMVSSHEFYYLFVDPEEITIEKNKTSFDKIPTPVHIIKSEEIQLMNYQTLGEAIQTIAGIHLGIDPQFNQFIFRGIGFPDDFNTRILILIDGHALLEWNNGSVLDTGEYFQVPMDAISQIEVMKGPGSVIYGTNAFLGVINVITHSKSNVNQVKTSLNYGSFESHSIQSTVNYSFENKAHILMSYANNKTDGDDLNFDGFDDEVHQGIFSKDFAENESYFIKGQWSHFTLSASRADHKKNLGGAPFETLFDTDNNSYQKKREFIDFKYNQLFLNGYTLQLRTYFDSYDFYALADYTPDDPMWEDTLKSKNNGLEALLSQTFIEKYFFLLGLEVVDVDSEISNKYITDEEYFVHLKKSFNVLRLFLKNEISLTDQATFVCGVQYNDHELFDDGFIYRAAFIQHLNNKTTSIKLNFNQGFRSPSIYEAFYEDNEAIISNSELQKEHVDTIELSMIHQFNDNANVLLSYYHNRFEDIIAYQEIYVPDEGDFQQYTNIDQLSTQGIDLSFKYSQSEFLNVACNVSILDDKGNFVPNFPDQIYSFNSSVQINSMVHFSTNIKYVSKRKTRDFQMDLNSYFNVNAGFLFSNLFNHFDLWIGGKNLTDEKIETALSDAFLSFKGPTKKRGLMFKFSGRF